jgi:hypothetical protein
MRIIVAALLLSLASCQLTTKQGHTITLTYDAALAGIAITAAIRGSKNPMRVLP